MAQPLPNPLARRTRSTAHLIAWLLASVLLHLFLLGGAHYWDSFGPRFASPAPTHSAQSAIAVGLISAPPRDLASAPTPAHETVNPPRQKTSAKRSRPSTADTPVPTPVPQSNPEPTELTTPESGAPEFIAADSTLIASDLVIDSAPTPSAELEEPAGPPQGKIEITRLPPAVRLKYELAFTKDATTLSGTGQLSWQYNKNGYLAEISAHALIPVFRLTSQGIFVQGAGLMPQRQTEQRALRSETAVNFNWEASPPKISFSTRTDRLPLISGTQDYASVIMQLASLLASQTSLMTPGAVVQLTIADTRQVRTVNFVLNDDGLVTTPYGTFSAWRFSYLPPADSYERSIEFWFSPELYWYPIKIRYNDVRRNQIYELLLKEREFL